MPPRVSEKIELSCSYFFHPNKPSNDCKGILVNVGGEEGSTSKTRLRCNNTKCQRVIHITTAELQEIIEQERQKRFNNRKLIKV